MSDDELTVILRMDKELITKAKQRATKDFHMPIPLTAITRMLIGLYGDEELMIKPDDLMKYSSKTYNRFNTGE